MTVTAADSGAKTRTSEWWGTDGKTSDVDVFLHAVDAAAATSTAKKIYRALAVDGEKWVVMRGRGVINLIMFDWAERIANIASKFQ
eukprot:6302591-Prymnesium_polylepis.1